MNDLEDRRKHPRIELVLKVEYATAGDFFADYVKDMSSGGVFIATNKPFAVGEQLTFDISFPGLLSPIRGRGKVRWRRTPDLATEKEPAGIGVAFTFSSEKEAAELRKLIDDLTTRPPAVAEAAQPASPFRVLLAEDNPTVREMFLFAIKKFHGSRLTARRELQVVEAENGMDAWNRIQEGSLDMAIIDYYMPVMDGGRLIRMIREDDNLRTLPVIVVSVGGEEAKQAAYSAGADLYLDKPVLLNHLLKSMELLLGLD